MESTLISNSNTTIVHPNSPAVASPSGHPSLREGWPLGDATVGGGGGCSSPSLYWKSMEKYFLQNHIVDPNEMSQNAAFHQGLHCVPEGANNHQGPKFKVLESPTCVFLNFVNHVMDSPILIGAICMKLLSNERN